MNFQLHFETSKAVSVLIEETKSYFGGKGFRLVKEEQDYLEFKRGSLFINRFTFNPLKWKSKTEITFARGGKVRASINIDTTHQLVIKKETNKWDILLNDYKKQLT